MDARSPSQPVYVFGDFRLDAARMTLFLGDRRLATTPRVISTLLYLVDHRGQTATREAMLRALWPGRLAEEASLSQAVSAVRKLLAQDEAGREWIITVPGYGYRFAGEVSLEPHPEAPLKPTSPPPSPTPPPVDGPGPAPVPTPPRRRLRVGRSAAIVAGAATAILALALGGAWLVWWRPTPLPAGRTEVVVADLQNETGDPVFNHVVPRILQVDLAQSPLLQVANDAKVAHTLSLMERPANAPLSEPVAREVCARDNGGAVIAPSIMRLGESYVLTVAATDCLDTRSLYQDKAVAPSKEAVGRSLETLSERLRRRLGEGQASISHSEVPLSSVRTASFEALTAYSEGTWLHAHNRELEAITAFRHATELDPDFAMAYDGLYSPLYITKQQTLAEAAATRAYALRNTAPDRDRLLISSHYHFFVDGDLNAALDDLKLLTGLYPRDPRAWANLSNVENQLGDFPAAVAAGERALALEPNVVASYSVLARALNHDGQIARAVQVDQQAMQKGLGGGDTRGQLIADTFDLGSRARADQIIAQSRGTPLERDALLQAYDIYAESGQMRRAEAVLARAAELGRPAGVSIDEGAHAGDYVHLGRPDIARAKLAAVPAAERDGYYDYLAAATATGPADLAAAQAALARAVAARPHDTLLNGYFAPEARAMLLRRQGRAAEAVKALDIASPLILHHIDALYWRGVLQLEAGDAGGAVQSFREVLAHPGFGYSNPYDLARLGLARALSRMGQLDASRRAYDAFLTAWRDADADLPPLVQAKAERARLGSPAAAKPAA